MELKKMHISASQLKINPEKLKLLMGITSEPAPEPYNELINNELRLLSEYPSLEGGYVLAENVRIIHEEGKFQVGELTFIAGKQITKYLVRSEMLAFFICTAGDTISLRSRELMDRGLVLEAYISDLTGSILVEEAMDVVHNHLKDEMRKLGLKTTNRYSPGYCDWKVDEQRLLFKLFPERFCGVSLNDSCLMQPVKSVSGMMGIGRSVKFHKYICHACSSADCIYRHLKFRVGEGAQTGIEK